jgi:putative aldouronate transport system permease protein
MKLNNQPLGYRLMINIKKHWEIYLMTLPPLLILITFSYVPMVGILMAFQNYSLTRGLFGSDWVGLKHFIIFFTSPALPQLLMNTFLISFYSLAIGFPFPIILAIALNEVNNLRFKKLVQTMTYLPYFISTVVFVGIIFRFLDLHNGFANSLIGWFGLEPINFMGESRMFRSIYVWSGVWQTAGYSAIIYIAALASVDQSLIEASIVDGANRIQKIIQVDIPSISPTIIIILIMSMGNILSVGFEKIYLMQNTVNIGISEVISTFVYKRGMQNIQYSYSTAVGIFNSVTNLVFLLIANWSAKRLVGTSALV